MSLTTRRSRQVVFVHVHEHSGDRRVSEPRDGRYAFLRGAEDGVEPDLPDGAVLDDRGVVASIQVSSFGRCSLTLAGLVRTSSGGGFADVVQVVSFHLALQRNQ